MATSSSSSCSSWTGQRGLQPLPSKSISLKRSVANYSVPDNLLLTSTRKNLAVDQGLPVLKISKTGKLQSRRLALTPDRRNLLVTSHRFSLKGFVAKGFARLHKNKDNNSNNNNDKDSSSSATKVISLEAIDRIQRGATSHRFFLARQEAQLEQSTEVLKLLEEKGKPACLSIVYLVPVSSSGNGIAKTGSGSGGNLLQLETLDLVVPDSGEYETLLTTLEDLTALHIEERQRLSASLQMLHIHWVELGKEWQEPISLNEFLTLCERLQVPLKRGVLSILFKEELASVLAETPTTSTTSSVSAATATTPFPVGSAHADNHSSGSSSDKLSFAAVANLLESIHKSTLPGENIVVEKLWQELMDTDPVPPTYTSTSGSSYARQQENEETISSVAFLSFLRSQQREFQTSLEEATDLVQILNHQITVDDLQQSQTNIATSKTSNVKGNANSDQPNDRLTKSRFISFLTSDANDLLHPGMGKIGADDMSRPLSHYWIHTSHDTYLQRLPNSFRKSQFSNYCTYQVTTNTTATINANASSLLPSSSSSTAVTTGSSLMLSPSHVSSKRPQMEVDEQQYTSALLRGVRCLEVDVWDGLDGMEPVVARFPPLQSNDPRISISVVLKIIATFLEQNPHSFPILLKLENHCTRQAVQVRLANLLFDILQDKIAKAGLDQQDLDAPVKLPSPEALRGKVVIIGKRPNKILHSHYSNSTTKSVTTPSPSKTSAAVSSNHRNPLVCQDDFDVDNDSFHALEKLREASLVNGSPISSRVLPDEEEDFRAVVGFDAKGPVRAPLGALKETAKVQKSPQELLQATIAEYTQVLQEVSLATQHANSKEQVADQAESRAGHYTRLSGWTMDQVRQRAAAASGSATNHHHHSDCATPKSVGVPSYDEQSYSHFNYDEEKSTKGEEGLEVHEVLAEFVEGSRGRYEQASREAMEAASREAQSHALVKEKEIALQMAKENLAMAQQREQSLAENAKKARSDAVANHEHAETAKERVVRVRELLKNCKDQTSTAGTVVQTALTEAKISEKRAADAELRAARAQLAAENERFRADDETRKEEALEQQVNDLHDACMMAAEETRAARERVEKAAAMLERVNEQLRILETSSQYRTELQARQKNLSDGYPVPRGGSFLAKHTAKVEEREKCRELIREASEETAIAEAKRKELQQEFEDRAYKWRIQAEQAAQARRTADRSLHVAEELMEQAEEEREAANLRHTARERAEATVESKDSHRTSLEAQLIEAEKAAAEASILAMQSRKRAEHLAKEWEKVQDHSRFEKVIEDLEYERDMAIKEYEAARREREKKDKAMIEEKRRLDTNSQVCKDAAREVAAETDRAREEHYYQHEAIGAYNESLVARQEANQALDQLKALKLKAEVKKLAVERAKEYKAKMDTMVEIPVDLARLTMLHSTKHHNWAKSLSLSNVQVHSFAQNVLLLLLDKHPEEERRNFHTFTKNHLTRVFPSWKVLQNKNITNYDPVLAWSLGCQLVASNLHSADESLLIADGRFRQNGSCGYVLKPRFLMDNVSKMENDQRWSLQIISGHNLPKPIMRKVSGLASPLVKISIYSGSSKETRISYRTRPARHVGLNPVWTSNNKFDLLIPSPSISMLSFSVWHVLDDGSEIFMGASALPASCMREGFRSIALFDEHHSRLGEYQNACLLVKTMRK